MAGDSRGFVYAVLGFFFGLFLFYKGIRWLKQKRLIENIPTSKTRSIAMGLVEVFGHVRPANAKILRSPLTGKECVYYDYKVEELRSTGKHTTWVDIRSGKEGVPFFLADETGHVLVDPKGAEVDIPDDFQFRTGIGKKEPEHLLSYIHKTKLNYNPKSFFKKQLRFTEKFLAPNDKCYVLGEAGDNPFVEDASGARNVDDIMIRKPGDSIRYYISDREEKAVLEALKWKVLMGMIGGPLISAGSLAIIFLYFGIL